MKFIVGAYAFGINGGEEIAPFCTLLHKCGKERDCMPRKLLNYSKGM